MLDVTFRESDSRVGRDNASENLGVFRRVAINSFRNEKKYKKVIKVKCYKATQQAEYTQKVLGRVF